MNQHEYQKLLAAVTAHGEGLEPCINAIIDTQSKDPGLAEKMEEQLMYACLDAGQQERGRHPRDP